MSMAFLGAMAESNEKALEQALQAMQSVIVETNEAVEQEAEAAEPVTA